jgi:Cys-tRNA(Pro)/Cys-tRNA(Cys) deacylase
VQSNDSSQDSPLRSTSLRWLDERGIEYRVHRHPPIGGYDSAKAIFGNDTDRMVKCLAFELADGGVGLVALRGCDRADYRKIADALAMSRSELKPAAPEKLRDRLDMRPGGVAPIPVDGTVLVVDPAVARIVTMLCGSGRDDATLEIPVAEWLGHSSARLADVAKGG